MRRILAISLSLAAVCLAGCKHETKAVAQAQNVIVTTIQANQGTVTESLVTNGTIKASNEVKVMSKTAGRISWAVEEGTRVSAGETLATLELPELASQLGIQQASLEMARANLASARSGLTRMRSLFRDGGISAQQLDGAETQAKVSARQVDSAMAAIRSLKTQLANGSITAPFSGIVTARYTDIGGMANPAAPLFNLAQSGRLQIDAPVSEKDIGKVKLGLKARVTSNAFPGETFAAKIVEIAPAIDPQTRQLNVKLDLQSGQDRLKLGMFVTAQLACATHPGLLLPAKAVIADGADSVIYLAEGKNAKKSVVNLGARNGDSVEVLSGVRAGETVILGGNNLVKDGDPIQIK